MGSVDLLFEPELSYFLITKKKQAIIDRLEPMTRLCIMITSKSARIATVYTGKVRITKE